MKKLEFYDANPIDELAWPEQGDEITTESSALEVFTDFNYTKPLVIEASISAVDAEKLMQKAHVRLKIVVDSNDHFLGIVSLEDLNNQEMMKRVSQGDKRGELSITDFMRSRATLKALDYSDLAKASINDVINALQGTGQQHCLVIDREDHKIRGIISASDIARKLQLSLNIMSESSFVGIFEALHR